MAGRWEAEQGVGDEAGGGWLRDGSRMEVVGRWCVRWVGQAGRYYILNNFYVFSTE